MVKYEIDAKKFALSKSSKYICWFNNVIMIFFSIGFIKKILHDREVLFYMDIQIV